MKKAYSRSEPGSDPLRPDLCVIGAGAAGLSVASVAASFGVSVVLVEKGRMGGECLNAGCVPSKALIAAARRAHAVREAGRYGIDAGPDHPLIDFARVQRHVKGVMAAIAPMDSVERYMAMGVQVIRAEAQFTDPQTVVAGGKIVKARRFVIAAGSRPAIPSIQGLDQIPYLTNETIFDLADRPEHLVVLGGGGIGVELAQAYRRLGSRVTIMEPAQRILTREDPEMAAVIERALRREGVEVRTGSDIERIEPRPSGGFAVMLEQAGGTVEGSHLLVAAGRRVDTEGLGLDAAGIEADSSGIIVDQGLRTSNAKVYAVGDCAGGSAADGRFTHVANHHAGLVIRNALFALPVRLSKVPIPRVTYTDPELAAVGLTEEEARATHKEIRILRWSFADNDRARAEGETEGHVKAVVTPRGKILGCAIAGVRAGELIMPWVLAMTRGVKVSGLAGLVYPYPTLSEVTKGTAVEFLKPSTQNRWIRRLIGVVGRLG